jgi:hypothetical protein
MPPSFSPPRTIPHKRGFGCFGCLWQLVLTLLLGCVLVIAITGLFAPWAFYLGGKFHILPYWQGWGKLHAKSGDYVWLVRIEPTSRGSKMYLETNLTGMGYICSPRGETYKMYLGGGMRKHLNLSTDGEAIHLYMHYRPPFWGFSGNNAEFRPSLSLRGRWQNPNLVMDDQGSIGRAFLADGSVYRGKGVNPSPQPEVLPLTFVEGSYSDFKAACAAITPKK